MRTISKTDINKAFGNVIKIYREKSKLTQEKLAEELGISLKYVSRIETGKSGMKALTLINCINILGIEPNVLFKSLIEDENIVKNIEISEQLQSLSDDKKDCALSIIQLLKNLK